jgi:hypothetical protein
MSEATDRRWDSQFPSDILNMPAEIIDLVKQGILTDTSWGNDPMPSFEFHGYESDAETRRKVARSAYVEPTRYRLWVNFHQRERRELSADDPRFVLCAETLLEGYSKNPDYIVASDDVQEIVTAITGRFFQGYVWAGGVRCPWPDCKSYDIETQVGSISYDDGGTDSTVSCTECRREWTESYRLAAVSITQGERQVGKTNARATT